MYPVEVNMRSLSVSSARSQLPSLLDDVFNNHETIIISRKGKPVAQLAPIPSDANGDEAARFPLRGIAICIADDFDEPAPDLWEALGQ
jgi:antitoxin (DNA-binding transcriptional repressor) of toxin-antitoxin stability system